MAQKSGFKVLANKPAAEQKPAAEKPAAEKKAGAGKKGGAPAKSAATGVVGALLADRAAPAKGQPCRQRGAGFWGTVQKFGVACASLFNGAAVPDLALGNGIVTGAPAPYGVGPGSELLLPTQDPGPKSDPSGLDSGLLPCTKSVEIAEHSNESGFAAQRGGFSSNWTPFCCPTPHRSAKERMTNQVPKKGLLKVSKCPW